LPAVTEYEKTVFINCPYDREFEPLFYAIVLTVAACGFLPTCARETEQRNIDRARRIAKMLLECKYSIHDLSRYQGEGPDNAARLNMAFELGIAFAIEHMRATASTSATGPAQPEAEAAHEWVVLAPPGLVLDQAISDLRGYQPLYHHPDFRNNQEEGVKSVISRVWSWLSQLAKSSPPKPRTIYLSYPNFIAALRAAESDAFITSADPQGSLPWSVIIGSARTLAAQMPIA
jgi:hypothetical protein